MNGEDVFTRAGSFKLDNEGRVVTAGGHPLQPEFTVPPETVSVVVTETGHIAAQDKDGTALAETDIDLYRFRTRQADRGGPQLLSRERGFRCCRGRYSRRRELRHYRTGLS